MTGLINKLGRFLLICFVTTACSHRVTVPDDALKTPHNILVIPYKAPPIKVEASHAMAVAIGIGLIGYFIQQSATADGRRVIADEMTKQAGTWNPSLVVAEECLNILKKDTKVSISNSSIAKISELPGAESVRQEEPRVFTETSAWGSFSWAGIWRDFLKTNLSILNYKKEHAEINADWSLEVFCNGLYYSDDYIHTLLTLKLSNISSNEIIALGYDYGKQDIPPFEEGYGFADFVQRFRSVSQKRCAKVLGEMGLISKQGD